jgi:hypothetical protein
MTDPALDTETHPLLGWVTSLIKGCLALVFIAVVYAFLFMPLSQGKEKSRRIKCADNLKRIGAALHVYSDKSGSGYFPTRDDLRALDELKYLKNGKAYTCPSSSEPSRKASASNYVYRGSGLKKPLRPPPSRSSFTTDWVIIPAGSTACSSMGTSKGLLSTTTSKMR